IAVRKTAGLECDVELAGTRLQVHHLHALEELGIACKIETVRFRRSANPCMKLSKCSGEPVEVFVRTKWCDVCVVRNERGAVHVCGESADQHVFNVMPIECREE